MMKIIDKRGLYADYIISFKLDFKVLKLILKFKHGSE